MGRTNGTLGAFDFGGFVTELTGGLLEIEKAKLVGANTEAALAEQAKIAALQAQTAAARAAGSVGVAKGQTQRTIALIGIPVVGGLLALLATLVIRRKRREA